MRVVEKEEMKEIERQALNKYGFYESLIVENVGINGAIFIEKTVLKNKTFGEIVFLVGKGNNGSDALAISRNLSNKGYRCRGFILFPDEGCEENLKQKALAEKFGVIITEIRNVDQLTSYLTQTQDEYLVIDGILGTGFRNPISNYLFEIINLSNSKATITVSLDIPSGVAGDSGEISGTAIKADYTLAIGLPKIGHYVSYGPLHSGEIIPLETGIPKKLLEGGDKRLLLPKKISKEMVQRNKFAHKNKFGHTLVIGGSKGLTGALKLASEAALKTGAGLVTAATWKENYLELCTRILPEVMTGTIPENQDEKEVESLLRDLEKYNSIVLGPGLGKNPKSREITLEVLSNFSGPVVVDADALKVLSLEKDSNLLAQRKGLTVLTPHVGEFSDLAGVAKEKVLEKPLKYLKEVIDQTNSCILVKSACSFLGFPTGEIFINYFPNDGMATGGSGDVLAGIIGGLLAQVSSDKEKSAIFRNSESLHESVCLAVLIHSLAGKHASLKLGRRSMSAGAIIDHLPNSFHEIENID